MSVIMLLYVASAVDVGALCVLFGLELAFPRWASKHKI
jgi:hypothetical protein